MLRRPPTAISLSFQDVECHLHNVKLRKCAERRVVGHDTQIHYHSESVERAVEMVSRDDEWYYNQLKAEHDVEWDAASSLIAGGQLEGESDEITLASHTRNEQSLSPSFHHNFQPRPNSRASFNGSLPCLSPSFLYLRENNSTVIQDYEDRTTSQPLSTHRDNKFEEGEASASKWALSTSPSPPASTHSPPPTRQLYTYGGFIDNYQDSPATALGNSATSQQPPIDEYLRVTPGRRVSISTIYKSQGAASSLNRAIVPTTSLTPKLPRNGASGVLLAHPPRRSTQYRARTLSYSFDESERASVAYESVYEESDTESVNNRHRDQRHSLHEDLLGTSLESSRAASEADSDIPSSPPMFLNYNLESFVRDDISPATSERSMARVGLLSSPQLTLPPPFSSVARNVSMSSSLPSSSPARASPIQSRTVSIPFRVSTGSSQVDGEASIPNANGTSIGITLTLPHMVDLVHDSRSSSNLPSSAESSPTPRKTNRPSANVSPSTPVPSRPSGDAPASTAPRRFTIYDDALPGASQPQTPRDNPEYRHQSRYLPAFTAPVGEQRRLVTPTGLPRSTRRHNSRGILRTRDQLDTPGFRGLYSGRENEDEEVQFNHAARRIWEISADRRAVGDEDEWNATPERELRSLAEERREHHV